MKISYWNVTNPTGTAILAIYKGAGIDGQLLSTQPISLQPEGAYPLFSTIVSAYTLPVPVPVTAGQIYTIVLFKSGGPINVDVNTSGNPYPGGQVININGAPGSYAVNFASFANWDMYFKTIIGGTSAGNNGNGNQNAAASQPVNTATATAIVTVVDDIPPTFVSCPTNMTATASSASGATVTYTTPVGHDNCSATVTRTAGFASGSVFPIGVTTVTHTVITKLQLTLPTALVAVAVMVCDPTVNKLPDITVFPFSL